MFYQVKQVAELKQQISSKELLHEGTRPLLSIFKLFGTLFLSIGMILC